jgi:hypothetical protein
MASWLSIVALILSVIAIIGIIIFVIVFALLWTQRLDIATFSTEHIVNSKFSPTVTADTFSVSSSSNAYLVPSNLAASPTTSTSGYQLTITGTTSLPTGFVFNVYNPSTQTITMVGAAPYTITFDNLGSTLDNSRAQFIITSPGKVQRVA